MERFKVIEKETKTKAFSKEGLAAARVAKDPKEKAKDEAREWIAAAGEEMNAQIETFEGEIDSRDEQLAEEELEDERGELAAHAPGGVHVAPPPAHRAAGAVLEVGGGRRAGTGGRGGSEGFGGGLPGAQPGGLRRVR